MLVTPPRRRKALKTFHHAGKISDIEPSKYKKPHVETQQDAILTHDPPSFPPSHYLHENQCNHVLLVGSALNALVGGHAAAFTSPLGISSRPGGLPDQTTTDEGLGDSSPTPIASAVSSALHSGPDCVDTIHSVSDSCAHVQQAAAPITSIFDRIAKLCNHVSSRPLVGHGARVRGAGKVPAKQRSASALNFDGLSAQALASERVHAKLGTMQATSLGDTRLIIAAGRQAPSEPDAHHTIAAEDSCSACLSPGWC